MASHHAHGHNPKTCPELIKHKNAADKARMVRDGADQIAKAQRGVTDHLNLQLSDLADSADLMANAHPDTETTETFFDNELEARQYREVLLPLKKEEDATIPRTQLQLKAHVKTLFKAFKCVLPQCECQEAVKRPFRNQIHDNYLVECLCWEILHDCIRRSKVLINLVESYEPEKYKLKKGMDLDFEERFNLLVECMANSKTICKHLFDVPYLLKVVDDPKTNAERVESNRKLNGQKARVMKRGKEAEAEDEKQGKRLKTEDAEDGNNSALVKTQPRRRRRRASAAPNAVQRSMNTPNRPVQLAQPARSAPAQFSMLPPTQQPSARSSLQPSPLLYATDIFDNTPTRRGTTQSMIAQGMLGSVQRHAYSSPYRQSMHMVPMTYGTQPFTPPFNPGYATTSEARFRRSQPGSAPRAPSKASSQYPEPVTPSDQTTSDWLSRPAPETYGSSSGYNSSASTISRHYTAAGEPQWTPDYKQSGLGDVSDSSSNTYTQTDGLDANHGHEHADLNELIHQAEAAQENKYHDTTESDNDNDPDEDAAYETE